MARSAFWFDVWRKRAASAGAVRQGAAQRVLRTEGCTVSVTWDETSYVGQKNELVRFTLMAYDWCCTNKRRVRSPAAALETARNLAASCGPVRHPVCSSSSVCTFIQGTGGRTCSYHAGSPELRNGLQPRHARRSRTLPRKALAAPDHHGSGCEAAPVSAAKDCPRIPEGDGSCVVSG